MPDYPLAINPLIDVTTLSDAIARIDVPGPHGQPLTDLRTSLGVMCTSGAAQRADWLVSGTAGPVRSLIRLVGPLPASERHHDNDAWGLVRHSLVVARYTIEHAVRALGKPADTAPDRIRLAYDEQIIASFLAGLGHDLGKAWSIVVRVPGKRPSITGARDGIWHPGRGPLLDYIRYVDGDPAAGSAPAATSVSINWEFGRHGAGHRGHEPMGAWMLSLLLPHNKLTWLGMEAANNVVATLLHSLGARTSNGLGRWLKDADRRATAEAMEHRRSTRRLSAPATATAIVPADAKVGYISSAADFVVGIRTLLATGAHPVNTESSRIFISPSHTILVIDESTKTSLQRLVYEANRALVSTGDFSGSVKDFYATGKPSQYWGELARARTPTGDCWCIPATRDLASAADDIDGDGAGIRHYVRISSPGQNRSSRLRSCIILRNDVLWGLSDPVADATDPNLIGYEHPKGADQGYCVDLTFALYRSDKTSPSCDPSELEFVAEIPATSDAITARRLAIAPETSSTGLAAEVWLALNKFAPLPPSGHAALAWRTLDTQVHELIGRTGDTTTPDLTDGRLCHALLAGSLDRITDLVAARASAPAPTTATPAPPYARALLDDLGAAVARLRRYPNCGADVPTSPLGRVDLRSGLVGLVWPQGALLLGAYHGWVMRPDDLDDQVLTALATRLPTIPGPTGLLHPDPLLPGRQLLVFDGASPAAIDADDAATVPPDLMLSIAVLTETTESIDDSFPQY